MDGKLVVGFNIVLTNLLNSSIEEGMTISGFLSSLFVYYLGFFASGGGLGDFLWVDFFEEDDDLFINYGASSYFAFALEVLEVELDLLFKTGGSSSLTGVLERGVVFLTSSYFFLPAIINYKNGNINCEK